MLKKCDAKQHFYSYKEEGQILVIPSYLLQLTHGAPSSCSRRSLTGGGGERMGAATKEEEVGKIHAMGRALLTVLRIPPKTVNKTPV